MREGSAAPCCRSVLPPGKTLPPSPTSSAMTQQKQQKPACIRPAKTSSQRAMNTSALQHGLQLAQLHGMPHKQQWPQPTGCAAGLQCILCPTTSLPYRYQRGSHPILMLPNRAVQTTKRCRCNTCTSPQGTRRRMCQPYPTCPAARLWLQRGLQWNGCRTPQHQG